MSQWKGKTKAPVLGIRLFVFILNKFGLGLAYFILLFVAMYYFLFAWKSNKYHWFYFREIQKFSWFKSVMGLYKTYYVFGQTLLDKVALMAGVNTRFTIEHEGRSNLEEIIALGKGGILLSAHVGNWEIAGQLLNGLKTTFHVLVFENEKEKIKSYLDKVQSKRALQFIVIKPGSMSHVIELNNAFKNNELVVMHGDRFLGNAPTLKTSFMGKDAQFPQGPFLLAAKFGVPLSFVYSLKETNKHYHFYSSPFKQVERSRGELKSNNNSKILLESYIKETEKIVKKYPYQWFNFYPFWEKKYYD